MAKIEIDEQDLLMLLEDNSGSCHGYLDRQTGEILEVFHTDDWYSDDDEPTDEAQEMDRRTMERLEADPDRYLGIEPLASFEGFRIMEWFVDELPEGRNKNRLARSLSGRKPFRTFKDALLDMGALREEWFAFHDKELRKIAMDWLEAKGVDAELVSPARGSR